MTYLVAVILGVVAVELFLRLAMIKPAKDVMTTSQDSLKIIRAPDMSDDEKQSALLKNSGWIFFKTGMLALRIIILGLGVVGLFWIIARLFSLDFSLIYKISFLIAITIASIFYAIIRSRFVRH